ncbi:MAG: class I SAM-dependent methyltransferase [Actinomycetota bacterium]|nr:class I SAM-dependent methyltransferase [Actinomycetota bacterium]
MLEEARELGFLGPGPVEAHLDHAAGFAEVVRGLAVTPAWRGPAADLGSGAGLPGLPLALAFSHCAWLLVESSVRRAEFLRHAVAQLGIGDRVEVAEARAEAVGRAPARRGRFDVVVARSFGPPAVVAECAAPLLRVRGWAVISEPPGGAPARWPADGLAELGMAPEAAAFAQGATYQVVRQAERCSDRYPRRVGVPAKRPLF